MMSDEIFLGISLKECQYSLILVFSMLNYLLKYLTSVYCGHVDGIFLSHLNIISHEKLLEFHMLNI